MDLNLKSLDLSVGATLAASVTGLATHDVIGYLFAFIGFVLTVATFIVRREVNRILTALEVVEKLNRRVSIIAAKLDINFEEVE